MWDSESQRIGKQKCTPIGYALHSLAELLGFVGLLLLLGAVVFLIYRGIAGNFEASLFWLLSIPFGVGIVAEIIFQISWALASKRGFEYEYENRVASWVKDGRRVTYKRESVKEE